MSVRLSEGDDAQTVKRRFERGVQMDAHRSREVFRWRRRAVGGIFKREGGDPFTVLEARVETRSIDDPDELGGRQHYWYWAFLIEFDDGRQRTMPVSEHLDRYRSGTIRSTGHALSDD